MSCAHQESAHKSNPNLDQRTRFWYFSFNVVWQSKPCVIDFHIFQERQKTEYFLLGVSNIDKKQTGLNLVISKFTVVAVLNFQLRFHTIMKRFTRVTTFLASFQCKTSYLSKNAMKGSSKYWQTTISHLDTIF